MGISAGVTALTDSAEAGVTVADGALQDGARRKRDEADNPQSGAAWMQPMRDAQHAERDHVAEQTTGDPGILGCSSTRHQ